MKKISKNKIMIILCLLLINVMIISFTSCTKKTEVATLTTSSPTETTKPTTTLSQDDSDCEKFIQLVNSKQYQAAFDLYRSSNINDINKYPNNDKYFYYCIANISYNDNRIGYALEILEENCVGILDADSLITSIHNEIDKYNGVWKVKEQYSSKMIFINNGRVNTVIVDTIPYTSYYPYYLIKYTFSNGKSTYAISDSYDSNEPSHVFYDYNPDSMAIIASESNGFTTFSGAYQKITNDPPLRTTIALN